MFLALHYICMHAETAAMSAERDGETFDFNLVQSYVPAFLILCRALAFSLLDVFIDEMLPLNLVFFVSCAVVYYDYLLFAKDKLSQAAGFMLPVAFLTSQRLLTSHIRNCDTGPQHPYFNTTIAWMLALIFDVVWASCSALYLVMQMLEIHTGAVTLYMSIMTTLMAFVNMYLNTTPVADAELFARVLLYYLMVIMFYSLRFMLRTVDRNAHVSATAHVCMHFLFVDLYVLVPSISIFTVIFVKVFYDYAHGRTSIKNNNTELPGWLSCFKGFSTQSKTFQSTTPPSAQDENLLKQLRAAQSTTSV